MFCKVNGSELPELVCQNRLTEDQIILRHFSIQQGYLAKTHGSWANQFLTQLLWELKVCSEERVKPEGTTDDIIIPAAQKVMEFQLCHPWIHCINSVQFIRGVKAFCTGTNTVFLLWKGIQGRFIVVRGSLYCWKRWNFSSFYKS